MLISLPLVAPSLKFELVSIYLLFDPSDTESTEDLSLSDLCADSDDLFEKSYLTGSDCAIG